MASILAMLAALATIGLLLALDPGGAIAQSGFPDYRDMDWKQLTVWGFRTIGVGVALLLVLGLWLSYRPRHVTKYRDSLDLGTRQRTGLPAAAVSVLEDREVSDRNSAGRNNRDVPAWRVAIPVRWNEERLPLLAVAAGPHAV